MSRIVPFLDDVADRPLRGSLDIPHRCHRPGHQNQEDPGVIHRVLGEILLGDQGLALPRGAVDDRDVAGLGKGTHAPAEAPRHPHQMGVIQLRIRAAHQLSPPVTKTARRVAHDVVGVEDDPVHAVVAALETVGIVARQLIGHGPTSSSRRPAVTDTREGSLPSLRFQLLRQEPLSPSGVSEKA